MKKVITYGTFDMFHEGHYNILKRAKEYGDYLIVAVTGENYDIGRGKLSVRDALAERIDNVKKTGFADYIIVEEYLGQKISDIMNYGVDTFVIGDDWKGKFDHIAKYCNLVYLERTEGISSTQIREEIFEQYNIGIATDYNDDNQLIKEATKVTGYHVGGVYSDDKKISEAFSTENNLETVYKSYDELLEKSDIVHIRCKLNKRANLIERALEKGVHVICDPPYTLDVEEQRYLQEKATENQVVLMENIKMVHIHVFNQLLWITQGGLIGDIMSFSCAASRNNNQRGNLFYELLSSASCLMLKVMGSDYKILNIKKKLESDEIAFGKMVFEYEKGIAVLSIGDATRVKNQLEIIGTKGTIRVDGNWWRGNYFELDRPEADELEIFNTNYQGNGFKYLLKTLSIILENKRIKSTGINESEELDMARIVQAVDKAE